MLASPCSACRSPVTCMIGDPHCNVPRLSVVANAVPEQLRGPVFEQRDALQDGDIERIDVVRRNPGDIAVRRLWRELDALGDDRSRCASDLDGLVDETGCGVCGQLDGGGEAPGAV